MPAPSSLAMKSGEEPLKAPTMRGPASRAMVNSIPPVESDMRFVVAVVFTAPLTLLQRASFWSCNHTVSVVATHMRTVSAFTHQVGFHWLLQGRGASAFLSTEPHWDTLQRHGPERESS